MNVSKSKNGTFAFDPYCVVQYNASALRKGAGVVIAHLFIVQTVNCCSDPTTAIARVAAASVADGPMTADSAGYRCTAILTVPPAFGLLAGTKMTVLGTCAFVNRSAAFFRLVCPYNAYCPLALVALACRGHHWANHLQGRPFLNASIPARNRCGSCQ
ncbi:hypothetical protein BV898_13903 [Hypsibius exemplaris]|uniref:Uncharacterized protein n=1 Tax=Hypsibius exemplaris TaxID=2072580 RepID=A0A1W0W992_HYPEX|nr:hypothetical protein BV898_13903 [Hypsibius exemplaris]